MKKFLIILAVLIFSTFNGCSLFKRREVTKELTKSEVKTEVDVKKTTVDTSKLTQSGISFSNKKNFTEEITLKNNVAAAEKIALTANFKLDESGITKDTLVKLVDVDDSRVSLSIYQNKKTNELMAKITSKDSQHQVPFSEIKIKRSFTDSTTNIDTSKTLAKGLTITADSSSKSTDKKLQQNKNTTSKPSWGTIGAIVAAIAAALYLGWSQIKKSKNNFKIITWI